MKRRTRLTILLLLSIVLSRTFCKDIVFINSDSTQYTKKEILCNGNVIISYCDRIISADVISYDKQSEFIHARGNVVIKDEMQNTYFLDSVSIHKNFSSGSGKNIKIIMQDKSRLAASECCIKDGKYELKNVVYTPCYKCTDSGELTWQVKALDVVFDPEVYTEYREAKFEFLGTPIFYTPYLTHVSSKVKRRSGFLVPKFSTSNRHGLSVMPQYLFAISDSQELILKPIATSKIGNAGCAYYGLRFPNGEFNIDASITNVKSVDGQVGNNEREKRAIKKITDSGYRGHIFSKLKYEIDDIWRCGFDINLASDRYYLKRFPFFESVDRTMESNIKLEGFDGRNYTSVKTAMFQSENLDGIPRILPAIERNYSTDIFYGTFNLDSYFINFDFNDNRSAQKFMSNASWEKEVLLPLGQLIDLRGGLSFGGLKVSERERSKYDSSVSVTPQINAAWKWPLLLSSDLFMDTIFTPIFGAIFAGNKKNMDIFEDPFREITDLNFGDGNKSISPYNTDCGDRIYYGFKLSGYKYGENLYRFTIGRSTELTVMPNRLEATGLKYKNSNIVMSLDIFLSNKWTLISNGSYSTHSKRWTRLETGLNFSSEKFCFEVMVFKGKQYFYNPLVFGAETISEEQKTQKYRGLMLDIGWQATSPLKLKSGIVIGNDNETFMSITQKNNGNYRLIRHHFGVEYKNECTTVNFLIERRNYRGGDLKPETVLCLVVHLKNLGI